MSDKPKSWRDAKLPQWVRDSINDEIRSVKLRAALSWPTEPRPASVPFHWGEHDKLTGTPEPGTYWFGTAYGGVAKVVIRKNANDWRTWERSIDDNDFSFSRVRGHLYLTKRDARLAALWDACDRAAADLFNLKRMLEEEDV